MTPTELKFAALRETGIVGVLETPSAEQGALATDRYAALHAQMLDDGVATWALTENIPSKVEQPMIWALAFVVAGPLGAPQDVIDRLGALGAYGAPNPTMAEKQLRQYAAAKYVSQPVQTEYF